MIRCSPFCAQRFHDVLREARKLTNAPPQEFQPQLVQSCAKAGVALTFVPSLPRLAISGVTRWLGPERAIVSLSLRHKSDDQLWFSFFHEACHVLEHKTGTIYLDALGGHDDDPGEKRANQFARDKLIPPGDFSRLVTQGRPTFAQIKAFATKIGVSPGIVVGRLQYAGVLPRTHGNKLKRWYRWDFESQGS